MDYAGSSKVSFYYLSISSRNNAFMSKFCKNFSCSYFDFFFFENSSGKKILHLDLQQSQIIHLLIKLLVYDFRNFINLNYVNSNLEVILYSMFFLTYYDEIVLFLLQKMVNAIDHHQDKQLEKNSNTKILSDKFN